MKTLIASIVALAFAAPAFMPLVEDDEGGDKKVKKAKKVVKKAVKKPAKKVKKDED